MPTTLQILTEQTARRYASVSGKEVIKNSDQQQIRQLVIQVINKVLSLAPVKGLEVPSCMVATYRSVAVDTDETEFYIDLVALPISLPMDVGLWEVSLNPALSAPFIPIPKGLFGVLNGLEELDLEGQTGYIREGTRVYFTADPGGEVKYKLLVYDPSNVDDYDLLPLSPEMEVDVVTGVLEIISKTGLSIE